MGRGRVTLPSNFLLGQFLIIAEEQNLPTNSKFFPQFSGGGEKGPHTIPLDWQTSGEGFTEQSYSGRTPAFSLVHRRRTGEDFRSGEAQCRGKRQCYSTHRTLLAGGWRPDCCGWTWNSVLPEFCWQEEVNPLKAAVRNKAKDQALGLGHPSDCFYSCAPKKSRRMTAFLSTSHLKGDWLTEFTNIEQAPTMCQTAYCHIRISTDADTLQIYYWCRHDPSSWKVDQYTLYKDPCESITYGEQ